MDSRSKSGQQSLLSKVTENRAALGRVQEEIERMGEDSREANAITCKKLDALSANFDTTQVSIMSLRSLGEQMMEYIGHFPREVRDLLRAILQSNWQIYRVLLQTQQSTSPSPTGLLESNIKFEDALGEYRELPYEYFRHWEVRNLLQLRLSGINILA